MPTTFNVARNNVQTTLGSGHTVASGTLTVATGKGTLFGAPSGSAPILVTVVKASALGAYGQVTDPTGVTIFPCTNVSGDVLTIGAATDGTTDQAFATGDTIGIFDVARYINDHNTAINAIETVGATVTSVGLTAPAEFTVSGSPVTGSGTLAITKATQAANLVYAGPTSGGSAAPAFRSIVAADVPTLNQNTTGTAANVTGTVAIANGGTGQASATTAFAALSPLTTVGDLLFFSGAGVGNTRLPGPTSATKQFLTSTGSGLAANAPAWGTLAAADLPGQAVQSISLTTPNITYTSPITFSVSGGAATGTLALINQAANVVFAGPASGGAASPTWRAMVAADVPSLPESKITNLVSDLALKAPLASPAFTGTVAMPSHYGAITADADGATITFDMGVSDKHAVTLGGNRTLAFTNDQVGQAILLLLTQDGTGSRTVTWPAGIRWPGGTVPTLTATAAKTDAFTLIKTGAGAYLGFASGLNL